MPPNFSDRFLGYLIAFGAIAPGMFLTAEVLQRAGFLHARINRPMRGGQASGRKHLPLSCFWWACCWLPCRCWSADRRRTWPSGSARGPCSIRSTGGWAVRRIVGDWFAGRWGRTLALGAGGLACGFLWEFWNFWAGTKWVYHLPFLGGWEGVRYFEMPVFGLIGFVGVRNRNLDDVADSLAAVALFRRGRAGRGRGQMGARMGMYVKATIDF